MRRGRGGPRYRRLNMSRCSGRGQNFYLLYFGLWGKSCRGLKVEVEGIIIAKVLFRKVNRHLSLLLRGRSGSCEVDTTWFRLERV